ncbi:MAG: glycosyltransferase family 61 protein [Lachnospiraceae bacterium]|nr:glycosyltransferase family 61 protein [Lachnospiraceae bacterium]
MKEIAIKYKFNVIELENECKRKVFVPPYFEKSEGQIYENTSPDVYAAELENVSIIGGSSDVIYKNIFMSGHFNESKDGRWDIRDNVVKAKFDNNVIVHISKKRMETIDKGILLTSSASQNYYHLVIETLSKLLYLDEYEDWVEYPIIVDKKILDIPQYVEVLEAFNKHNRKIISIELNESVKVNKLIYISPVVWMPLNVYDRYQLKKSDFMISDRMLMNVKMIGEELEIVPEYDKIFLSRLNVSNTRLVNELAIRDLFAENGFKIVKTEEMTFEEQIKCFKSAKVIVGSSGAALVNLVFCQPETLFVCIVSSKADFWLYSTMAYLIGLNCIFLDPEITKLTLYPAADELYLNEDYTRRFIDAISNGI